jgi:hypothetical protein
MCNELDMTGQEVVVVYFIPFCSPVILLEGVGKTKKTFQGNLSK